MFSKEGMTRMGTLDGLYTALFCFSMVFALLGGLYALIKLITVFIRTVESRR
jgi:hypothetical protein